MAGWLAGWLVDVLARGGVYNEARVCIRTRMRRKWDENAYIGDLRMSRLRRKQRRHLLFARPLRLDLSLLCHPSIIPT
jgi:hypothetical protein